MKNRCLRNLEELPRLTAVTWKLHDHVNNLSPKIWRLRSEQMRATTLLLYLFEQESARRRVCGSFTKIFSSDIKKRPSSSRSPSPRLASLRQPPVLYGRASLPSC